LCANQNARQSIQLRTFKIPSDFQQQGLDPGVLQHSYKPVWQGSLLVSGSPTARISGRMHGLGLSEILKVAHFGLVHLV
jgi:hypothetical protein